jgi:hypothetical protein
LALLLELLNEASNEFIIPTVQRLEGTFILEAGIYFKGCHRRRKTGNTGMNCLLEAMASVWMGFRRSVMTEPPEEEVMTAQEGLEQCRRNMEGRERELQLAISRLTDEALAKKREGDALTARSKVLERRRVQKRLERLRHGLDLVDTQLDAIKTSELDKEIMLTLKASTSAMRKAGINLGVQEVETVMSEIDEQMREVQDITSVLSNPLVGGQSIASSTEDAELDAELELLEAMGTTARIPESREPARPAPVAPAENEPHPGQPRHALEAL